MIENILMENNFQALFFVIILEPSTYLTVDEVRLKSAFNKSKGPYLIQFINQLGTHFFKFKKSMFYKDDGRVYQEN